jgi:uncharacterized protein (DUF2235 family)
MTIRMRSALLCLAIVAAASVAAAPRRLVVCLDGTSNSTYNVRLRTDGHTVLKPTNTLKMCRAVLPTDPDTGQTQMAYYDIGVGSLAKYPGTSNKLLFLADRGLGGAYGAGYEGKVEDALHFLVLNYEPGDEVFVFGFSRGAAETFGLTRFLEWNGGLPKKEDAYYLPRMFRAFVISRGAPGQRDAELAAINKDRQLIDNREPLQPFVAVPIKYLGVWDTVMALGARFKATGASTSRASRSFYGGKVPPAPVQRARQALAIDEMRFDFRPEIWLDHLPGQKLEQRWFAGVHSNVGGGYSHDGLANIAFKWILQGAMDEGLKIDPDYVKHFRPFPLDSLYDSSSGFYRTLDKLRHRAGAGRRELVGRPAGANLELDPSVVKRMRESADKLVPGNRPPGPYRPQNVLQFLACQPDLDAYLVSIGIDDLAKKPLPGDVLKSIAGLRPRCSQEIAKQGERDAQP